MSVEDVVNVLKDDGFCGDGHTLHKGDVSISVKDGTIVIGYKLCMMAFNLDGLYIETNGSGVMSIFDKGGACMFLAI